MPKLNVAGWVRCTEAEGPGKRFALWVQGCLKRCVECCNPGMLPVEPLRIFESEDIVERILAARETHGIEGVTFLGGEPLLQAQGLARVAERCRQEKLSVMVFTGYTRQELDRLALPGTEDLLRHTDLLVDGPYLPEHPETTRNWIGSSNQVVHHLTDFYPRGIEFDPAYRRSVEIRLGPDGVLRVNGWPGSVAPPPGSS